MTTGRVVALYAGIALAVVVVGGFLLSLLLPTQADSTAIRASALIAVVVQVAAFASVRLLGQKRMMVGWGVGSLLRLFTLVIYGLLAVKVLALPAVAALISLTAFFFVTTLVEPVLLRI